MGKSWAGFPVQLFVFGLEAVNLTSASAVRYRRRSWLSTSDWSHCQSARQRRSKKQCHSNRWCVSNRGRRNQWRSAWGNLIQFEGRRRVTNIQHEHNSCLFVACFTTKRKVCCKEVSFTDVVVKDGRRFSSCGSSVYRYRQRIPKKDVGEITVILQNCQCQSRPRARLNLSNPMSQNARPQSFQDLEYKAKTSSIKA